MNELHDEIYSDDSWLRLVELNKINALLDESLDCVWKMIYGENREKHEKINIDKHKDIVGYVSKYTDIVNDKLELVNVIGELLDGVINDIQNEADMVDDMKQACEIDIDILKSIHNALAKILERWRDDVLAMVNRSNAFSKPKDKPDTKKKDSKPDTKKKDSKPDTKNSVKNKVSNRIKYEIQDIAKYRKVLIKMIDERIYMLDLMNMDLAESIAYTDTRETEYRFHRECQARPIAFEHCWGRSISEVYAVDVALGGLRESVGNGIWPKGIDYDHITSINEIVAAMYYINI